MKKKRRLKVEPKFDEAKYRRNVQDYLDYTKVSWAMAVETAEQCVGPPGDLDDKEVIDARRVIVYDLARGIFIKLVFDIHDFFEYFKKGKVK